VCIALLGMLALGVSILSGSGIACAAAVAFTVLAALTLLPALLGFFGPRTLTRGARRALAAGELRTSDESPAWARWVRVIERRPALFAVGATALVLVIAIPVLSMRVGSADPTPDTEPQSSSDRWARGLDAYASQFQIPPAEVAEWFTNAVGDRFGEEAIYSAARAWIDDELSLRDRSLAVLASLITMGGAEEQLRMHTRWAIDHGCTRAEIEAMAALLAIYAGFTRAANGLMVIRDELAKLEA